VIADEPTKPAINEPNVPAVIAQEDKPAPAPAAPAPAAPAPAAPAPAAPAPAAPAPAAPAPAAPAPVSSNGSSHKRKASDLDQHHEATDTLYIRNFVRPFTLPQAKEMLQSNGGTLTEFWMDSIRTHCFATVRFLFP